MWLAIVPSKSQTECAHQELGSRANVSHRQSSPNRPRKIATLFKDLRHDNLLDEDWQFADSCDGADCRVPVPLIPGVNYYFAAATVGRHAYDPKGQILGDLLVRTEKCDRLAPGPPPAYRHRTEELPRFSQHESL